MPLLFTFVILSIHSKLTKFHNFRLLFSPEIDKIKSLLLVLSKKCLKLVIYALWAFLISLIFLLLFRSKHMIDLISFDK